MRRKAEYAVLRAAFAKGCDRFGFRLVHYSVLGNHLHMLAEAKDRNALSRGMQGLLIRVAKGLNRLWSRKGSVFADRYHDRILRTPKHVRHALAYVLHNARPPRPPHPRRCRPLFVGLLVRRLARGVDRSGPRTLRRPVAAAHTWLLKVGWRRHRLLGYHEVPRPAT